MPFVWDPDPVLLRLGNLHLRWYGVLFAGAFLCGLLLLRWMLAREEKPVDVMDRLLVLGLAGALIGGRLGHVLFYRPSLFLQNPLEVLAVWHGGLASHGGALGLLAGLWLAVRNRPWIPYLWLLDRTAVAAALGGALIRVGNFFNSELVGRPAEVPWAVVFARLDTVARHPVQLYETAAYLGVFLLLLALYLARTGPLHPTGPSGRERTGRGGPDRARAGALVPGLLLGLFLVAAFGARFLLEYVKVPPEPFTLPLPLTMGQLLSIPMVVAGVVLLWRARRVEPTPCARGQTTARAPEHPGAEREEGPISRSAPPSKRRPPRPRRRR